MKKFSFKRLSEFVEEVNLTNSTLDKIEVLKKYEDLKKVFVYIYDTTKYVYGVTSDNVKKLHDVGFINIDVELFELLDSFNKRKFTGHNAIKIVNAFIRANKDYEELIYNILDRNLKTRTDSKLINKVWPGLIPEFNVALAESYKPEMNIDFTESSYYASRKCDGVRLITIVDKGKIKFFSREGKEFHTLNVLKKELEGLHLGISDCSINGSYVLDGELCLMDEYGNENFQDIMKEIRRKDHQIENPKYLLFDFISLEGFHNSYSERKLEVVYDVLKLLSTDKKHIKALEQVLITNEDELLDLIKMSELYGWEGLIIRKSTSPYEGKRTKNMLKIKKFHDAEYIVNDVEFNDIRYIIDGKEVVGNMLSKVVIEHKGNNVGVGSGFTLDQRLHFRDHPEDILGKVITVKYFEETQNKDGSYSLRFPTIKCIHGERREM